MSWSKNDSNTSNSSCCFATLLEHGRINLMMKSVEIATKRILKYLAKNPLCPVRDIADNASSTRINYNTTKKIIDTLTKQQQISDLFGFYYIIPSVESEIPFLIQITNMDVIMKPKFRKNQLKQIENRFQKIVKKYIDLFYLQVKIKNIESKSQKDYDSIYEKLDDIRTDLNKYLKSFKIKKRWSDNDFHSYLSKHIEDRYFKDSEHFHDLMIHSKSLKEKAQMLSIYLRTNSVSEIADQFDYVSNKIPRTIIEKWFYKNGNLLFGEIYAGIKNKEITDFDASNLYLQWQAHMGLRRTKTKDGKELVDEELKQYRKNFMKNYKKLFKIDIKKVVDIKAYGIS